MTSDKRMIGKLVLFDIDGTLLLSGGAGTRALNIALEEAFGIKNPLDGVRLDGKTDHLIVKEALARAGREVIIDSEQLKGVFDRYVNLLGLELEKRREHFRILPGVLRLLSELTGLDDVLVGLATGNIRAGALAKLEAGNLSRFFRVGGFGSDSEDRTELILSALADFRKLNGGGSPDRFIIVGDTPRDIFHGKAAGAEVIAVATGSFSFAELDSYEPDLTLPQLNPIEPVLDYILGNDRRV